jgi:hypothetical protein
VNGEREPTFRRFATGEMLAKVPLTVLSFIYLPPRRGALMKNLIRAAIQGDLEFLRNEHAKGASVLADGDPGELTTLHWACAGGQVGVVEWLLGECGADASAKRNNAYTPLHSAAMGGHSAVVMRLLAAGADVNAQTDPQGYAPLHSAAFGGHFDTVRLLVENGARTDLRNYRNETPADTATRQQKQTVADYLRHPDLTPRAPTVQTLTWGEVALDDGRHFKDAKLWPGGAREWDWSETGTHHVPGIQPADVLELLDYGCDVIILSRGQHLVLQTCPETLALLSARHVEVFQLESRQAAAQYNSLAGAGRRVGALLHSTC